jgi:uncharacterized protein involved in exopolysaccharide biosynthesis
MTVVVSNRSPDSDEMSLMSLAAVLLARPRLVLVYPLVLSMLALGLTFLMTPRYIASVIFVPEHRSSTALPPAFTGLASQFGVNLPSNTTQSPLFYVSVLESREIAQQVLRSRFPDPNQPAQDSVPLLTLIGTSGRTQAESLARGVVQLRRSVRTAIDQRTGIIRLSVETSSPALSAAVAMTFVQHLNRFNAIQRQSQAGQRRRFIEGRITDVERSLRNSEANLTRFYETNRSWQQSPKLVVQEGRLRREIDVVQDVYLTLEREYELSRIEEVNDTPVLTVVDPAVPPVQKAKPQRAKIWLGVFIVGVLLGGFTALVGDYLDRIGAHDPGQFARLPGPLRTLFRRIGTKSSR